MAWIQEKWGFKRNPFGIRELTKSDELQELFVDRKAIVNDLLNTLSGSDGGVAIGISGIRGSGKSSVCNKVLNEIEKDGGLGIRIKASGTFSELDFLHKLFTDIVDQLEPRKMPGKVVEEIERLKINLLYTEKVSEGKASLRYYQSHH